jgi:NAD(P)-dependent dehydrogenase (short-subunit alcohol dehydrogenase family)
MGINNMDTCCANLQGKNLLFTSTVDELGQHIIFSAIKQNAKIILADNLNKSQEAKTILAEADALGLANNIKFIPADIKTEEGVDILIDTVMQDVNTLDGIIINSKIDAEADLLPVHELSQMQWETLLNNNLRPLFFLTRRLIEELLIQGKGGKLVCITMPHEQVTKHAVYNSIQTALHSYCRSITKEYGRRNILCNVIMPTSLNKTVAYYGSIAELVLYLLGDSASFITGEVLKTGDLTDF